MSAICLALVTRNQADFLRIFLENYLRHGADSAPLLVIDDGSEDGTESLLAALPRDIGIGSHRIAHVSIANARNHALRLCPTPWIAFSDTDCILERRYFETLKTLPGRYPEACAVEGAIHASGPPPPFTHSVTNVRGGFFATANMAFRVDAALAAGGFDEAIFGNYREDTDLALTLLEKHGTIPFCTDWIVVHPHVPRRFASALAKAPATRKAILLAEIDLYRKHPDSYARVRFHPQLGGTLKAWCLRHAAGEIKGGLAYLFSPHAGSLGRRLRAIPTLFVAGGVSFWEQICMLLIVLGLWSRAKTAGIRPRRE